MLDDQAIHEAAERLWQAWHSQSVIDDLPAHCRPATRGDGYRVQSALLARSGEAAWGWKIAATSEAGQKHIGVDGPLGGRLFAGQIHRSGDSIPLEGNRMRVAEVEFAFRIGQTLAPRQTPWTVEEVFDAVDALLPAIEVPDSRFSRFERAGAAQLIGDNACAWRFAAGDPAPELWRGIDLSRWFAEADVGGRYQRDGVGRNVLGDPRAALVWLVNELSSNGIALAAGQIVTTGTCLAPLEIVPGDRVSADFGVLGGLELSFGA
jgi:2-keto-4-pentenoate hydratase